MRQEKPKLLQFLHLNFGRQHPHEGQSSRFYLQHLAIQRALIRLLMPPT